MRKLILTAHWCFVGYPCCCWLLKAILAAVVQNFVRPLPLLAILVFYATDRYPCCCCSEFYKTAAAAVATAVVVVGGGGGVGVGVVVGGVAVGVLQKQ